MLARAVRAGLWHRLRQLVPLRCPHRGDGGALVRKSHRCTWCGNTMPVEADGRLIPPPPVPKGPTEEQVTDENRGALAPQAASILMKLLYAARGCGLCRLCRKLEVYLRCSLAHSRSSYSHCSTSTKFARSMRALVHIGSKWLYCLHTAWLNKAFLDGSVRTGGACLCEEPKEGCGFSAPAASRLDSEKTKWQRGERDSSRLVSRSCRGSRQRVTELMQVVSTASWACATVASYGKPS